MGGSVNVFGQKTVVDDILAALSDHSMTKNFLIRGPSGSGKSYTAGLLIEAWEKSDPFNTGLFLIGDNSQSERAYFPFTQFVSSITRVQKKGAIARGSAELAKGIPFAGDFISYLIETLSNNQSNKKKEVLRYLNETEQKLVFDIEKIIGARKVIFVIDNIHWWDKDSLSLLYLFVDRKFAGTFPAFAHVSFLCIFTDDQPVISPSGVSEIITHTSFQTFSIEHFKENEYLAALNLFGFTGTLNGNILHLLFSITGSNLFLLKRLAEYISQGSHKMSLENLQPNDVNEEWKNYFLRELFSFRFRQMNTDLSQIFNTLEYAAVIGLTFSDNELLCISREDELYLANIIEKAKQSNLIESDESNKRFSHVIIREYFLSGLHQRKYSYSKKFADCLTILRPSDYFTRAHYLVESGNRYDAVILYMIGYFKNIREGKSTNSAIIDTIENTAGDQGISKLYKEIKLAYQYFENGNYADAIEVLNNIEDVYPKKVMAEKYYLLALCLSRPMENHLFKEAITCLEGWDDLKTEEGEIWFRIMSTKLVMHAHLYDFDLAKNIEKQIMFYLAERVKFDESAEVSINIIRRKSGSLHIAEIACDRTKASLDYFSQTDNGGGLLRPVQCYMSAANHSGNLLALSKFDDSFITAKLCIDLLREYENVVFPKSFIPANNYIISGWLNGIFTPDDAINMYAKLMENLSDQADHLLIKNNCAVIHCLNDDLITAKNIFTEIRSKISNTKELDPYYVYFILSNWVCLQFILGEKENIIEDWTNLKNKIPKLPESSFLYKRHELIHESFLTSSIITGPEWNRHLFEKDPYQLGPAWSFLGTGFLISDLQFWSES